MATSQSPPVSSIKDPLRRASSLFMSLIQPVASAEWADPSNPSKPLITQRLTYILNNEEVTVRLASYEGGEELKVDLFSLEHGVYGGVFHHSNLPSILADIKGGIVHFDEGNLNKVILGVGPHGMEPIELSKYPSPTIENKTETLQEEVRRLRYHLFELDDSYNDLKTRYDSLEAKVNKFLNLNEKDDAAPPQFNE